jgi:hypothetical protein
VRKVYDLDPHFATGEATVQPVLLWGADGRPLRERFGVKTASEASEYIKAVQPKPGTTIVLVLALGAYERYDLNRNGDGFNEFAYKPGMQPSCGCCHTDNGAWVSQDETLLHHYPSFEQYGKVYRHHQNTDPLKACGDVIKAFWNPQMHRVELLVGVENEKAPDLVERISDGDYPAVSMGCRIKYDVCTICGHRAPTRKQYCDHLKYGMRQVTPSGLRAGALNPSPRFFDISWVIRPADQTGYMLKKVAHENESYTLRMAADSGEYLDRVDEKRAAIQKLSDIDKVIRGVPVDHKTSPLSQPEAQQVQQYHQLIQPAIRAMPEMDNQTLSSLSKYPLAQVLSTFSAAGVILTTPEFVKLMVERLAPGTVVPEEALDAVVAMQGHIFDTYAQNPQLLDQVKQTGLFDLRAQNVRPEIAQRAEKYLEKRSTVSDYLSRALLPRDMRDEEPRWTDTLHVTDPGTGQLYQTTRGAARAAHDEIAKKQLMKMVGGAALLGGAYKLLAPNLPAVARPLALGTAGLLGYKHLQPNMGAQYRTEEGVDIPTLTELHAVKNSSDLSHVGLPILGSAALVAALGHDYDSRLRRGYPVDSPYQPIHRQMIDRLGSYASDHPALAFLSGLAAYGGAKSLLGSKFSAYMADILEDARDGVTLPSVDVDKAAEKLGHVVVR